MRNRIFTIIAALLTLTACHQRSSTDTPSASGTSEGGQTAQQQRKVIRRAIPIPSDFNHITNLGSVDIIYTQGNYNIDVEGDSATLNYLDVNFDCNVMTTSLKSDASPHLNHYGNTSNVKMYVSCPDLKCVAIVGNGGFESRATWRTEDLQLGSMGSGPMKLSEVECTTFSLQTSDMGDISIAHLKADDASIFSTSSAHIEADIQVNNMTVLNEGKQTIKLTGTANRVIVEHPQDPNFINEVTTPPVK